MKYQKIIEEVIEEAARSFRMSVEGLGYQNSAKSAPVPEINFTLHLASSFLKAGYWVFDTGVGPR